MRLEHSRQAGSLLDNIQLLLLRYLFPIFHFNPSIETFLLQRQVYLVHIRQANARSIFYCSIKDKQVPFLNFMGREWFEFLERTSFGSFYVVFIHLSLSLSLVLCASVLDV